MTGDRPSENEPIGRNWAKLASLFEVAAALLFLVTAGLWILLTAYCLIRVAAYFALPSSILVPLIAAIPIAVPVVLVTLLSRGGRRQKPSAGFRSGWLARLDPAQPSDPEITAAAHAALDHFSGDTGAALAWANGEAIRFLCAGDLRRNLIAVRLKRAIYALRGRNS